MKTIVMIATMIGAFFTCWGQSLNDVVEGSHRSKSEQIYLSNESKVIFFGEQTKNLNDSMLIQTPGHYEIYLQAYNPLLKSHTFESKLIDDELQVALDKALAGISSDLTGFFEGLQISTLENTSGDTAGNGEKYKGGAQNKCGCTCEMFVDKDSMFTEMKKGLGANIKSLTEHGFINRLAALKFKSFAQTKQDFDVIVEDIKSFRESISKQDDIDKLMEEEEMVCDETYTYILKDYQAKLSDELKKLKEKLDAIEKVADQISKALTQWSKNGVMKEREGFWYFKLTSGDHQRGKSVSLSLTIKEIGELNNQEFKKKEKETASAYHFHLRKYKCLLPEVSTGIIYTSVVTPSYALGEGGVIQRTSDNSLEQFKFSQMINANFNIKDGGVLPFLQAGVALNNDIPIGIVGAGVRLRTSPKNGIAVAFGCAMTGVKNLRTLEEGQVVTDDATLQNDLKYDFIAKPYIGIQFNF